MLWEAARSTNISKVGYDEDTEELQVLFHSGVTYRYHNVPQVVYDDFKACGFSGRFLNAMIKDRFTYERA